jgi:hypothetical protein
LVRIAWACGSLSMVTLAVEDPAGVLERADDLAPEVGEADDAVEHLLQGDLLDVDAASRPGLVTRSCSRMMKL